MSDETVAYWSGPAGDAYTARNPVTTEAIELRRRLWAKIAPAASNTVLEVGANVGLHLRAIQALAPHVRLSAVEPNDSARNTLIADGIVPPERAYAHLADVSETFDLVLTAGCLIHVPPDCLLDFCRAIHRCSHRWIVAIEYFSKEPREVIYRGESGKLWTRDYGAFWLDNFPDLKPVDNGFAWSRNSGLDDLTWWLLSKKDA